MRRRKKGWEFIFTDQKSVKHAPSGGEPGYCITSLHIDAITMWSWIEQASFVGFRNF